jgi:hypothetical protein
LDVPEMRDRSFASNSLRRRANKSAASNERDWRKPDHRAGQYPTESPAVYDTLLLSERSARLLLALRSSKRKPVSGAESYLAIAKKSCAPDRQRLKTELREN